MKKTGQVAERRFFYWIWSPFHVLVFALLTVLFFTPAILLIAMLDNIVESDILHLPPSHGALTAGPFLAASVLAFPIAALLAQTVCYIGSLIRIQGETEIGQRLAVVVAGVLIVLLLGHRLPAPFNDFPLRVMTVAASFIAAVALVLLNLVAWVLRKLTGREIIFSHLAQLQQAQLQPRRKRTHAKKTKA